ncbi:hypothetical protein C8T65DRAFT_80918 [Cerioporus squamosus]|nr:hypothetical protein C8T65DRAFT_80918 [Cerioporus squamosus]
MEMRPEELDLTVQYYRPEEPDTTPSLTQNIFDNAARLVLSVAREARWHNPPSSSRLSFAIGEHCFQWNREISQLVNNADVRNKRNFPEWEDDVEVGDDELWALCDLEEFDHSHLHRLLESQPPAHNHASSADAFPPPATPHNSMTVGRKRSPERDSGAVTTQSKKRPKFDESSICDVIPEPHFLPSRATTDDPDYQPPSVKLQFSPLPPHTLASAMEYMRDPYARLSWIIPVRGRLCWDGATAASILAVSHDAGSPISDDYLPFVNSDSSGSELMWTRDALKDLWNTLINVRELGRFGPLSLSFHVALPAALASSMERISYVGSHKQTTISMSTSMTSNVYVGEPPLRNTRSPLDGIDYIKVFHDAKYTQSLRAVLRAWSYKKAGQKMRLLKEAKLVLVAERSQGLVIC